MSYVEDFDCIKFFYYRIKWLKIKVLSNKVTLTRYDDDEKNTIDINSSVLLLFFVINSIILTVTLEKIE